jgi:hypothetical protein
MQVGRVLGVRLAARPDKAGQAAGRWRVRGPRCVIPLGQRLADYLTLVAKNKLDRLDAAAAKVSPESVAVILGGAAAV